MTAFDLLLVGGTVIDPASGTNARLDVGVRDGRIAAIAPRLARGDAAELIDVSGQLVIPGLIDLHTHVYPGVADLSVEADETCLGRGVTTAVDAGSSGAHTFAGFRRWVVEPSRTRILAFLNISLTGIIDVYHGELHDLAFADPERAVRVALANPDVIVGYKVRLSTRFTGPNALEALRRALEAGRATSLPVMAHIGGTAFQVEEALAILRPGDIVTHAFTGWNPGSVVAADGRVADAAREARARGVRFDVGHGQGSFAWAAAESALDHGFRPDTISTDLHRFNVAGPVFDMATTMSKLLHLGLSLDEVVAMSTSVPGASLGPAGAGLGRLEVGGEADVSILALEEGRATLVDSQGIGREVSRRLVPTAVLRAGRSLPVQPQVMVPPPGIG